jgi:hypothetical protein
VLKTHHLDGTAFKWVLKNVQKLDNSNIRYALLMYPESKNKYENIGDWDVSNVKKCFVHVII